MIERYTDGFGYKEWQGREKYRIFLFIERRVDIGVIIYRANYARLFESL